MANQSPPPPPSPPPVIPIAPSSSPSSLHFSLKISEKLDEENFHLWRQQIEPFINAHDLTHFVVCPEIPVQFLADEDRRSGKVNPAYSSWRLRDQMLLSWLQSTLTKEILARVLGANHAYELWDKLFAYFQKQTRAKARHLRVELRSCSLESSTIKEYLLRIRTIADSLASIGDPVPMNQHIDVILEGLPQDYAHVVSVIESKFELMDIDEVEALLLAHELRMDKFKKTTISDAASLNLTHAPSSSTQGESDSSSPQPEPPVPHPTPPYNPGFKGGRGGKSGRGRGGRGGRLANVQCQVCFKFGHLASTCWHRFNQSFQPSASQQYQGFPPSNAELFGPSHGFGSYSSPSPGYGYSPPSHTWTRPQAQQRIPNVYPP